MNDDLPNKQEPRSWLERLSHFLHPEPQDREELLTLLQEAVEHKLLDPDAMEMIQGVIDVSEMQVRDIMVPRAHMVVVEIDSEPKDFIPAIKASGHSRFPVIGETRDEIKGILLAKDLIDIDFRQEQTPSLTFNWSSLLRPAFFVPESKRLDALLREFRQKSMHMALIVDEYGGIAGLVTIEDILEEIVGEITDEHDISEDAYIKKNPDSTYLVKALAPIDEFNEYFGSELSDEDFDTIGGLVTQTAGHLPKRGEIVTIGTLEFKIINTDNRRIRLIEVRKV
ncbi:MAG: CBS domain-containing protein [Legionellales bacterium]|nr:CBS domain-containing protein [Legionellales bacterium]